MTKHKAINHHLWYYGYSELQKQYADLVRSNVRSMLYCETGDIIYLIIGEGIAKQLLTKD
jgi:hypothetical protein